MRRGALVAERNSLLNCRTGNGTAGSNPALSAKASIERLELFFVARLCWPARCGMRTRRVRSEEGSGLWLGAGGTELIPPSPQKLQSIGWSIFLRSEM